MAREASNNIYCEPKFVAQVICYTDNDLRRTRANLLHSGIFFAAKYLCYRGAGSATSRGRIPSGDRLGLGGASFALRRLTVDVGLLPYGTGSDALALFVLASQPLAFALGGRALALVRAQLSLVCHQLAVVRDPLALVGHAVSSTGLEFASPELGLALDQLPFALIELVDPAFQLRGRLDTVLRGHSSP